MILRKAQKIVSGINVLGDTPILSFLVEQYLEVYRRAQDIPQGKFEFPQTEAQEIGWDTKPLVRRCDDVIP